MFTGHDSCEAFPRNYNTFCSCLFWAVLGTEETASRIYASIIKHSMHTAVMFANEHVNCPSAPWQQQPGPAARPMDFVPQERQGIVPTSTTEALGALVSTDSSQKRTWAMTPSWLSKEASISGNFSRPSISRMSNTTMYTPP